MSAEEQGLYLQNLPYWDAPAFRSWCQNTFPGAGLRRVSRALCLSPEGLRRLQRGKGWPNLATYLELCWMAGVPVGTWVGPFGDSPAVDPVLLQIIALDKRKLL